MTAVEEFQIKNAPPEPEEKTAPEQKDSALPKIKASVKAKEKKVKEKRYIFIKGKKIPLKHVIILLSTIAALIILPPFYFWLISEKGLIEIKKKSAVLKDIVKIEPSEEKFKEVYFVDVEEFVVTVENTLKPSSDIAYFKIKLTIETDSKELKEELDSKIPHIRDSIVAVLSNRKIPEIGTTSGKLRLKDDIRKQINSFLLGGKISDVYFTKFVYQL
jgi:flagellar FliL protein